ncbi:MAG: hypothetical protein ABIJ12_03160 [bacterium]
MLSNHSYFPSSYTLFVLLDRKSCAGNLIESVWWKDWQKYMLDRNLGFAFITSKADSIDIVIASRLDSVFAQVFVLLDSDTTISHLWKPGESSPLKLLVDSTGEILLGVLSVTDQEDNNKFIQKLNSIIRKEITPNS